MSMEKFSPAPVWEVPQEDPVITKIVGIGDAGTRVVSRLCQTGMPGAECVAMSADTQALEQSACPHRVGLGKTAGFYQRQSPGVGRQRALESADDIRNALRGAHIVILAAGLGGSTGTGAAPVVANMAKEQGPLVLALVTSPFPFEGKRPMDLAGRGIADLLNEADAVLVFPNKQPVAIGPDKSVLPDIFARADEVFCQRIRQLAGFINQTGPIRLDFRDLHGAIKNAGAARLAFAAADCEGDERQAAQALAQDAPLLDSVRGAQHVLVHVEQPEHGCLEALDMVHQPLRDAALPDADFLLSVSINNGLGGGMRVTTLATGFDPWGEPWQIPPKPPMYKEGRHA